MRRFAVPLAAMLAAWSAIVAADPPVPGESVDRIAALVRQLGSPRFAEREAATEALNAIGQPAVSALESAVQSPDAEVRRRATELLERIGQRAASARLLQPTVIALKFHNTPLDEAVKQLAKSSGLRIELAPSRSWAGRKVTIESNRLPIWEAIELFCRKADVHEWDGFSPLSNAPATPNAVPPPNVVFGGGLQGQVIINGKPSRSFPQIESRVVLLDGPGPSLAIHQAGSVRFRVWPPGTAFPLAVNADEVLLPLQASAEPQLRWAGVLDVRVDRAVDDRGVSRSVAGVVAPIAMNEEMTWMMMPNGAMVAAPSTARAGLAALKLKRTEDTAKSIRELSGELTAQVAVTETLARLDGPFKSGLSADSPSGVTLKITEISTPADGEIRLSIDLQIPPEVQPVGPLAPLMNNRVVFGGGMVMQQQVVVGGRQSTIPSLPSGTTEYNGLSVEDAQGRPWAVIRAAQESMQINMQGTTAKLVVILKPREPHAAAARLVFRGSRPTTIAIPFRFRDIPLS